MRFSRRNTAAAQAVSTQLVERHIQRVEWSEPPEFGWPPSLFARRLRSG
jgi:hypothetical protein